MDPTREELNNLVNAGMVMDWVGAPGSAYDRTTTYGSLLNVLGATPDVHTRVLAIIPEEMFMNTINEWMIGGIAPTMVDYGQAALVGRICRLACGAPTQGEARDAAVKARVDAEKESRRR